MRKTKKKRRLKRRVFLSMIMCIVFAVIFMEVKAKFLDSIFSSPKERLDQIVVVLDAGHGGYDPGSGSAGYFEKDITLEIAKKVGSYLEKENIQVLYTREQDIALGNDERSDLKKRVDIANKANADYMISIHLNATSGNERSYGFEIWEQSQSSALANHVQNALANLDYTIQRDTKNGEQSLYVLKNQEVSTILVELGFIDDSQDMSYINSASGKDHIANAIADGIIKEAKASLSISQK